MTAHAAHRTDHRTLAPRADGRRWLWVTIARVLGWLAVLVGVGFLVGGPLAGALEGEDGVVEALQGARTSTWDAVSHVGSRAADTITIVGTALVVGLVLRLVWKSWLEPLLVWAAVALQSAVFLTTTLLVSRERPELDKLDPAPPTSSFPSGHTGASTALYLSLGLVLASRVRSRAGRVLVVALLLLVPLGVGLSRLYRGMHHPSDVAFGLLNGTVAVLVVRSAVLGWREQDARPAET